MESDIRWGQDVVFPEPSGTQRRTTGMLAITKEMVGSQLVGNAGVPAPRDWTIYLSAEGLEPTRLAAPRAKATIRYGSGASTFIREIEIPAVGVALHVVASWLSVDIEVRSSGLPSNGNVQVSAYASPGRPTLGRSVFTIANAQYTPGNVLPIPMFCTSVLAYATRAGASNALGFNWQYNAIARGTVTNPPANMVGSWGTARAIPQDATGIVLLPVAADNFLSLGFEVQT